MSLPSKFTRARVALEQAAQLLPKPQARAHPNQPPGVTNDQWWALVKYASEMPVYTIGQRMGANAVEVSALLCSAVAELSPHDFMGEVPTYVEAREAVSYACGMYHLPLPLELTKFVVSR